MHAGCRRASTQAAVCTQAADEGKFGVGSDTGQAKGFTGRLQAALQQQPGQPVPLCDQVNAGMLMHSALHSLASRPVTAACLLQVAVLVALMSDQVDVIAPAQMPIIMSSYLANLHQKHASAMRSIASGSPLTQSLQSELEACLSAALRTP